LKVGTVNLVVRSAEFLHIVVWSSFKHLAGFKMAADIHPGWTSLSGDPFANAQEVERMHCIR
jgi:hypothetical protein